MKLPMIIAMPDICTKARYDDKGITITYVKGTITELESKDLKRAIKLIRSELKERARRNRK